MRCAGAYYARTLDYSCGVLADGGIAAPETFHCDSSQKLFNSVGINSSCPLCMGDWGSYCPGTLSRSDFHLVKRQRRSQSGPALVLAFRRLDGTVALVKSLISNFLGQFLALWKFICITHPVDHHGHLRCAVHFATCSRTQPKFREAIAVQLALVGRLQHFSYVLGTSHALLSHHGRTSARDSPRPG